MRIKKPLKVTKAEALANPTRLSWMVNTDAFDRDMKIEEIRRCKADPVYWMKKYVVIKHAVRGKIPFLLYPFQEKLIRDIFKSKHVIILSLDS
jgi:hypothetical protein